MTNTRFSKSSKDVKLEAEKWERGDERLHNQQRRVSKYLANEPRRSHCVLCGSELTVQASYKHRSVEYSECPTCRQIQTSNQLPEGYPYAQIGEGFEEVYPRLDSHDYLSRRNRIYMPKAEWIVSCMKEFDSSRNVLECAWLDIGCGAGYFINAIHEIGVDMVAGIDENKYLVDEANRHCRSVLARATHDICRELELSTHDIITAFFVLEHLEEAEKFWDILSKKKSGTIFAFSVPTFGFATMLEGAFDCCSARNLDSCLHTQLYTDYSIDFILKRSGYMKIGEWIFGQDAQDWSRLLAKRLLSVTSKDKHKELEKNLIGLIDPLQNAIDQMRMSDARHVLAIKQ